MTVCPKLSVAVSSLAMSALWAASAQAQQPVSTAGSVDQTAPVATGTPAATSSAAAQDTTQLTEIVVTAQKRAENLQRIPISVAAIGGPELQSRSIETVMDLGKSVPGLTIQEFNGIILPFLRGVGNLANAAGNESSVAAYVDGVYFARPVSSFFDLASVDHVEVLKGPQGTLFGRNSTGGVINVITRDPSYETKIMGSLGYGRFDAYRGNVYATTKLSDKAAIDFSFSGKTDDGYGNNIAANNKRYGYEDSVLARSKLLWEPSDATRIVVSGFYSWSKSAGLRAPFPGTKTTTYSYPKLVISSDDVGFYNTDGDFNPKQSFAIWGGSLRAEQDLSFAKLVSISAYTHTFEKTRLEGDDGPRPDFGVTLHAPVKVFTQELQLLSNPGGPFNWITGFYYYNNSTAYSYADFNSPLLFGPGLSAPAHQKALSYAGFAQATYELTPGLKLTGGIRYTKDKTSAFGDLILKVPMPFSVQTLNPSTTKVNRVTFKGAVDYQATEDLLLYASFSRGFKSGNYNIITYNSEAATKPESIDAYEVGFKSELFDRRVRLNAAAFHYKIKNPQTFQILAGGIIYSNAGGSRVNGAEFDGQFVIARGLTGRAGLTYLDSKYTDYPDGPTSTPDYVNGGALPAPDIDAAGNRTPLAAKTTFNIGGDYVLALGTHSLTFTADLFHNSGFFFEPDNFLRQKAYDLVNGQIKFTLNERLALRAWGRNLTDKKYNIAAGTQIGPAGYLNLPGAPRTYGVAVDFNF